MPLGSGKMNRFIFWFQRRVWCPKCTPLSSSCFMLTTAIAALLVCARPLAALLGSSRAPGGAPPWRPAAPHPRRLPVGTEVATAPPDAAGGGRAKSTRRNGAHRTAYASPAGVRPQRSRPSTAPPAGHHRHPPRIDAAHMRARLLALLLLGSTVVFAP